MNKLDETIKWYNTNALHYVAQANRYLPRAQINDFVRFLPKNAYVLDAGCGSGRDAKLLHEKGIKVIGLDLAHELIEYDKKTYPNLEFLEGDFLKLPFSNQTFSGVWAQASLVHLESTDQVKQTLSEFGRVLKTGGILHVQVKAKLDDEKFVTLIDKRNNTERFFQFYTQEELRELTEAAGFEKIKLYQYPDPNSKQKYEKPIEWIIYLGRKVSQF